MELWGKPNQPVYCCDKLLHLVDLCSIQINILYKSSYTFNHIRDDYLRKTYSTTGFLFWPQHMDKTGYPAAKDKFIMPEKHKRSSSHLFMHSSSEIIY